MVTIASASVEAYALEATAPTDGLRRGAWLTLTDSEGRIARGDLATWPGFAPPLEQLEPELRALASASDGRTLGSVAEVESFACENTSPVCFAWQSAALSLLAAERRTTLAALLGASPVASVAVNALVDSEQAARQALAAGFSTLKVKVRPHTSLGEVAAIRGAAPDAQLRLDANGTLELARARAWLEAARSWSVDYVEDPLASDDPSLWHELAAIGVPLAIDQRASDVAWADALRERGAASVLVLKPMFDGGLLATKRRAEDWQRHGGEVVITSALESSVGVVAAAHLAAALGLQRACGLTSPVCQAALPIADGRFHLSPNPTTRSVP